MINKSNNDIGRPVPLKQLADELGFHSSSIRKMVARRGFRPFRLSEGKNKPLYLKATDAKSFIEQIHNEQNNKIIPKEGVTSSKTSGVYLIEVPSYAGESRFKIGWSDNIHDRLSTYRTIIPDFRVKAVWQTTDAWCERAALKCAERFGQRVHQELFQFDDFDSLMTDLNDLFSKMGIKNKHHKSRDKAQRIRVDRESEATHDLIL